jgi:hypothetical protein
VTTKKGHKGHSRREQSGMVSDRGAAAARRFAVGFPLRLAAPPSPAAPAAAVRAEEDGVGVEPLRVGSRKADAARVEPSLAGLAAKVEAFVGRLADAVELLVLPTPHARRKEARG